MPVDAKDLRKALRRFAEAIADEAEHNQEFADKLREFLAEAAGSPPARGSLAHELPGDPFEVFRAGAEQGLREWLEGLQIEELRQIVRYHKLDSTRNSDKWKSKDRFVQLLLDRVPARSRQGEVFRHYGEAVKADKETLEPNEVAR